MRVKGQSYHEVICGPMFSGKTREMQRLYRIFKVCNFKVQVFRRDIDTRYSSTEIITHDGIPFDKEDVFLAKQAEDISKQLQGDAKVIMIDEAMLYNRELVNKIDEWVNNGRIVITTVLPTDYRGEVFGIASELLAKADFITSLYARCMHYENGTFCHEPATRTMRKVPIKKQVLIGGLESYEPRCRKHHFILKEKKDN